MAIFVASYSLIAKGNFFASEDRKDICYLHSYLNLNLGLLYHDQAFEPDPVIAEALRRLNLKEPWVFDQRKIRLIKAHNLAMHHEKLPKSEWTKWEDVSVTMIFKKIFYKCKRCHC